MGVVRWVAVVALDAGADAGGQYIFAFGFIGVVLIHSSILESLVEGVACVAITHDGLGVGL